MILGPQAVKLAAFPVYLIQENKKFAKTEKLYLYLMRKQMENSVPTFFFLHFLTLNFYLSNFYFFNVFQQ
jgi:hypothetical protein